uniref:Serpentine receptor class gamma n=1 Tax=Panagrellus redivivus TaxID=6233 RepID=A0A7E4ZVU6_PANRE
MVWSHFFELLMIIGNPVVLVPYTCGFMNGPILYIVTTQIALVFIFAGFCIFVVKNIATFLSLLNRFLFTFYPYLRKYLDNKYCFMGIMTFSCSLFAYLGSIMLTAGITFDSVRANAVLETGDALAKYFENPSFIFARSLGQKIRVQFVVLMFIALVVSLAFLCSVAIFIRNVFIKRKTAKTVNQLMMSLLLMTLVQFLTNVVFLVLPIIVVLAAVGFQIKNKVNIANALISMCVSLSKILC